jgi:hypothetical protein
MDPAPRVATAARGLATTIDTEACPGDQPSVDAVVEVSHPFRQVTPIGSMIRWFGGERDGSVTITATGVMPCVG